jgi:hypothetical protein
MTTDNRQLVCLPEIFDEGLVPAGGAAGEAVHVVDVLHGGGDKIGGDRRAGAGGFGRGLFDERFPGNGVLSGMQEDAFGLKAVTAGAAGFLLVSLDGFGHSGVQDEADVGAVDAHAEGNGGDDEVGFLFEECFLGAAALLGRHAGVIAQGLSAEGFGGV